MHDLVGIVRNDRQLAEAEAAVAEIEASVQSLCEMYGRDPDVLELANMATVARLIVRSAISRKESRGLHYTTDYPDSDDANWVHDTCLAREQVNKR
jgi:L-aspartate oxidase